MKYLLVILVSLLIEIIITTNQYFEYKDERRNRLNEVHLDLNKKERDERYFHRMEIEVRNNPKFKDRINLILMQEGTIIDQEWQIVLIDQMILKNLDDEHPVLNWFRQL